MKACIKYLSVMLAVFLCTAGNAKGAEDQGLKYMTGMYLTAEGIGLSEADAKNNALAEMSRIFESRIRSESLDRVKSIVKGTGGEEYEQSIERNIRVLTDVDLRGVRIIKTWKSDGSHHALAALEKLGARDDWLGEIKAYDSMIEARLGIAGSAESRFVKLRSLNEVLALWIKRAVIQSRLRVIGHDAGPEPYDIKSVFRTAVEIKAAMPFFVEVGGEHGLEAKKAVGEALGKAGLLITDDRERSDVIISGEAEIKNLDIVEPGIIFARAAVSLSLLDRTTGLIIMKVSETARAGHPNSDESIRRAVLDASMKAAGKMVKSFEEPEPVR